MMSQMLKHGVIALAMASLISCRTSGPVQSRAKMAPVDRTAKNVAFIVGSPNDLTGVARDVAEVSRLIKEGDLGYEVVVLNDATTGQILSKAEEIGRYISDRSTVLFYFSGHGSSQGYLISQGHQAFRVSSVAKRIGKGMNNQKFKRFIAVIDSCFSGQNVDGNEAMFMAGSSKNTQQLLNDSVGNMSYEMTPKSNPDLPFEQALILAAAQRYQESLDFGSRVGGAFTAAWRKLLAKDLKGRNSVTVSQLLDATRSETRRITFNSHTPVWKAMPESILSETLVSWSEDSAQNNEIYLALGDASDGAMVLASIPSSVSFVSAELCRGNNVACTSGAAPKLVNLINSSELTALNRMMLRSEKTIKLNADDVLTLSIRDGSGKAIRSTSVVIRNK